MRPDIPAVALCLAVALLPLSSLAGEISTPLTDDRAMALIRDLENSQTILADVTQVWTSLVVRSDRTPTALEQVILRRDGEDLFILLITKPKTEAGKGYLGKDKTLWNYDASIGRWERRTERDRIGGSDARRSDFASPHYVRDYDITALPDETIEAKGMDGKAERKSFFVIGLKAKPQADTPAPRVKFWLDKTTLRLAKEAEFSLSNKLLQTRYVSKWSMLPGREKKTTWWIPSEMHLYDELQKGNETHVTLKAVDFTPHPPETFTKAWLESKLR